MKENRMRMETTELLNRLQHVNKSVNHLNSGLPRWVIETAMVIMVLAAFFSFSTIYDYFQEHMPWAMATMCFVGEATLLVGVFRGMRSLYRPMKWLFLIVLSLQVFCFVCEFFSDETLELASVFGEIAIALAELILGLLLFLYYKGRLGVLGGAYFLREVMVLSFSLIWLTRLSEWFETILVVTNIVQFAVEVTLAWCMRRLLV